MHSLVDHVAWVRALARQLVGDVHLADDLAQETCLVALRRRPRSNLPLRGWLATVLRNLIRQRHRGERRRDRREQASARAEATESTLDVVEKLSIHTTVALAVQRQDEPYRSTLLMRYFENRTPSEIALRTGVPVSTVKTRLARGLEQLRSTLDAEHGGDGRTWFSALLPLVHGPSGEAATASGGVATTTATTTGGTAAASSLTASIGALTVSTSLKIGAAVLLTAGLAYVATREPNAAASPEPAQLAAEDPAEPEAPAVAAPVRPAPSPDEPVEARAALDARPEVEVEPVAPEAAPARELTGRVLDAHGRPLAGVPLRRIVFGPPDEEGQAGETDAPATLDDAGDDRAVSGADGRFRFPRDPRAGRIVADGERHATIYAGIAGVARGTADSIVVVGPRIALAGFVTDEAERPLAGVELSVELPDGFRNRFTQVLDFTYEHRAGTHSAEDGRFEFEPLAYAEGARLVARDRGFEEWSAPLPLQGDEHLHVVLTRPSESESTLAGIVVDELGLPVADADVAFGVEATTTDEAGRFAFDLDDPDSMNVVAARFGVQAGRVTAIKAGHLPATVEIALDPTTGEPLTAGELELQLAGAPLELEGRVVDAAGEPLAGVEVWVKTGRLFAFTSSGSRVLESLLAGEPDRTWRTVTTGSSGRFTLTGLDDRAYVVAAHDPETLVRVESAPFHPADGVLTLTLDRSAVWRRVAGHVVTRTGEPLAGVRVSPATDVFLTQHQGRTLGTSHSGRPGVTTDEDGSFELEDVPRDLVYLRIGGENVITDDWGRHVEGGLAALSDGRVEELEVVAALRMHLRVELIDPTEADSFGVLDEEGHELLLNLIKATSRRETERMPLVDGRSAVLATTDAARTIVLYQDDVEVRRAPLQLTRGEITVVTP